MGSFNDQSLGDCQNWCVTTAGCWSIGFHEPNGDPSFTNCYLKDTVLTSLSSFVTKENWTTYYCTIARKIIRIIENQNLFKFLIAYHGHQYHSLILGTTISQTAPRTTTTSNMATSKPTTTIGEYKMLYPYSFSIYYNVNRNECNSTYLMTFY